MQKTLGSLAVGLIVLCGITVSRSLAQPACPAPGLQARLVLDKTVYFLQGERVKLALRVVNCSGGALITSVVRARPLQCDLTFTDPQGKGIVCDELRLTEAPEPLAPRVCNVGGTPVPCEAVETLAAEEVILVELPDAHAYFTFEQAGRYTGQATIPLRLYASTVAGGGFATRSAVTFAGVLTSNEVRFALVTDTDADTFCFPIACPRPPKNTTLADCNDTTAAIKPGGVEIRGNGQDDDCNPVTLDRVPGDVSGDGVVNLIDPLRLIRARCLGRTVASRPDCAAFDVWPLPRGDGRVDLQDFNFILRLFLGDLNSDQVVNGQDLLALVRARCLGQSVQSRPECAAADLAPQPNGNGRVDAQDIAYILSQL